MNTDYAPQRDISRLEDCYFYHSMDLPGVGKIKGDWNLLPNINEYLGHVNFKGKRVLDVGCGAGLLSFHMEQQGASVVSYDLDKHCEWDMVPFANWEERKHIEAERKTIIDKLNNAYWFAHKAFQSNAKVAYGSVYQIPEFIGPVDIAVYGSILLHLRDPFLALQSGLRLVKDTVIITEMCGDLSRPKCSFFHFLSKRKKQNTLSHLNFLPNAKTSEPKDTWWNLRPEWVERAIGVLGFEDVKITLHTQRFERFGKTEHLYTVVGKRTAGTDLFQHSQ